jgi:hypothetical protein
MILFHAAGAIHVTGTPAAARTPSAQPRLLPKANAPTVTWTGADSFDEGGGRVALEDEFREERRIDAAPTGGAIVEAGGVVDFDGNVPMKDREGAHNAEVAANADARRARAREEVAGFVEERLFGREGKYAAHGFIS